MSQPRVALAWFAAMRPPPFDDAQRAHIDRLCDVSDWQPLETFTDERARAVLADAEVLVGHWGCPTLDSAALALAPRLRRFVYAAGTVKWVVTPEVFDRGIVVSSGAPANGVPVAYFTLAAVLFGLKNVFVMREMYRDPSIVARDHVPVLGEGGVYGKRVGVVGASLIGRMLIEHLRAVPVEIVVYDPYLDESEAERLGVRVVDLDTLCATSDVVSLHAPPLPTTEAMIDTARLASMKDGAVLVNTARGMLIDHDALVAELTSGRISAVLDVTDPHEPLERASPLLSLPNVFLTPHIAGAGGTTDMHIMGEAALEELRRCAEGLPPAHEVRAEDWDRIA